MGADIQTFLNMLVGIAAGIVTIGGAVTLIVRIAARATAPQHEVEEIVELHEQRLDNDHKRLNELESSNRLILRGVMQLMSHEVDGNHTSQLKETRDDIEQFLINR